VKIHYLNCGTMRPRGARWFVPHLERVPCICLLVETAEGLVLVDTGLGTRDMQDPSRLGSSNLMLNARSDPGQPAIRQIERLGFRPEDIGDIVCTHLDRDHAGGLPDFPHARVHVLAAERDAALNPRGHREKDRYRRCHFAHGPRWEAHDTVSGEKWFGLECMREMPGLPPGLLLVPLPGHTRGHCGVALDTGEGWLLHCGDAYYVKHELREGEEAPLGVRGFRRVAHMDHAEAMRSLARVKIILGGNSGISTVAAHDRFAYEETFGKPLAGSKEVTVLFRKELCTAIDIRAGTERVWEVLTDFGAYPEWNPMIRRASGRLEVGARLKVHFEPAGSKGHDFRPKLTVVEPGRELRWLGWPRFPGLLDIDHYWRLEEGPGDGSVHLVHGATVFGLLTPLAGKSLERKSRGPFEEMNRAMKERAERIMD
jgi:hypothetical protein